MNIYQLIPGIVIAVLVSSCATMDKSECREADWKTIGLEDGARGRPVSYLGNHRKACAEYGVKPDLAQYQSGHKSGIRQFCTDVNGFRQGRAGRRYDGVCPADLSARFLAAYETGRELYDLSSEIDHMLGDVRNMEHELEESRKQLQQIETSLISGALSARDRKILLDRFKELQTDIATLEIDSRQLEISAAHMQGEFEVLDSQHGYR